MEYLAPEHQDLATKGLDELRGKLHPPQRDVLDNIKSKPEDFSFARIFRIAQENTNRSLPTASLIWKHLLGITVDKQQKFAVMNKLFHVQIATGPWNVALETAKNLFNETMLSSLDSTSRKPTTEGSLADPSPIGQQLFEACINLGSMHRLLKELHAAEELYKKAMEIAASVQDFDKEAFAKIHLAMCLLDRGELKQAIETYFNPLMIHKSSLSNYTRALYLQNYGNACRSAADWGKAKEYLREALELAKGLRDAGLVSSCCGDLGNVFRSEGRYKDAERLHTTHYNFALSRGDIHGLAIACGNIGFLKFYNPEEFDDSVVYQFIEYSLAEQIGDFARMGITFNKIGKLYTTLGYYEEAVELFQIALDQARRAGNVAGEGMAWGNLGTVYRALEQFEDAIACHIKYRDNAERRLDIGGLAIMQHQLAMDYFLSGNLPESELSILSAFQTLERIRSQIGEEDKSKLSNFEKNQAEAYNLLQVVLVAQCKYKEAFVLADVSRGRALSEIVQRRLCGSTSSETGTSCINEEFITESFHNLRDVSLKLSTTLVLYSVVKEFDKTGAVFSWVYTWVLQPTGSLNFSKTRLKDGIETKVELDDEFVVSLRRSMGLQFQSDDVSKILRCERLLNKPNERKAQLTTLENEEVLESLKGLENMFATDLRSDSLSHTIGVSHYSPWSIPLNSKEQGIHERPTLKLDFDIDDDDHNSNSEEHKHKHFSVTSELKLEATHSSMAETIALIETTSSAREEMYQEIGATLFKSDYPSKTKESLPESSPVSVDSPTINPGKLSAVAIEVPSKSPKVAEWQEISQDLDERVHVSNEASITSLYSEPATVVLGCMRPGKDVPESCLPSARNDTMNGPSCTHPMDTETANDFATNITDVNHTETLEDLTVSNKSVSGVSSSCSFNDVICEPTGPTSKETEASEESEDQRSCHNKAGKGALDCLESSHSLHENAMSGPKPYGMSGTINTHSKEETCINPSTAQMQSKHHAQTWEENEGRLDPINVIPEGIPPGAVDDDIVESSDRNSKETVSSESFITSMQSPIHTEIDAAIQHPLAPSNAVSKHSMATSCNDAVPDPLGQTSNGTGGIGTSMATSSTESKTELEEGVQDRLPQNKNVSEHTNSSCLNSNEAVSFDVSITNVELGKDRHEYSAPSNDVTNDTTPCPMDDIVTNTLSANSKDATGSEVSTIPIESQNHVEIRIEQDKLDTVESSGESSTHVNFIEDYDLSGSSPNGKKNDDTSLPSDRHVDPELAPWRPMLNQLHKILIEPIVDFLPRSDANPRIAFIPQDFLLKVPFAALQGAAEHRYVIEDFVISTSPAIHFLELACASRNRPQKKKPLEISLLAVGNPTMPFAELPQLPSAQREVHMISEIVNSEDSELFVGAQAKKEDVVAAMPRHKILHFATHAIIDDSDSHGDFSMKGLVVLAKSGNDCNGLLTAEEVRCMELNAELVVLSCCDTGLGKVTGDGVLGLSRAFLAAGAACVIVTLWKIDDRSASELMKSFYREYKTSRDAAVSLQKAMKILQAKEETRSPQHWAAFSIVGSTR